MNKRLAVVSIVIASLVSGALADAPALGGARAGRHQTHRHACRRGQHHRRRHRCRASRHLRAGGDGASRLVQIAATSYTAQVAWPTSRSARAARIYLNGQLIDRIGARHTRTYTLANLWPASSFPVSVALDNGAGHALARYSRTVSTGSATGAFPRLYAPTAFINTPISATPRLASDSAAMVSQAVTGYASDANLSNSPSWGIPIFSARPQSHRYSVSCLKYGCGRQVGRMHIPAGAQPDVGSDGHLVVLQPNGSELDMWTGRHTASGWAAGSRSVQSAGGSALECRRTSGCSAADAAGFALAAGVIRPEELAQGHVDHALVMTTPDTRQGYIACPASSTDGRHDDASALPLGAHLQLDPGINVASLPIPSWQKVIAVALQQYGAYVVDTGGSLAVSAESDAGRGYDAWARAGVRDDSPSLGDLPWGSMRVLSTTRCGP